MPVAARKQVIMPDGSLLSPGRKRKSKLSEQTKERIVEIAQAAPILTHEEIANSVDCERSTVTKVLARYGVQSQHIEDYKAKRADIFAGIQSRILQSVTEEDIQKASLQVKAMAFGVLYDKERLERGQSTDNVNVITKHILDMRREMSDE